MHILDTIAEHLQHLGYRIDSLYHHTYTTTLTISHHKTTPLRNIHINHNNTTLKLYLQNGSHHYKAHHHHTLDLNDPNSINQLEQFAHNHLQDELT